MKNNLIIKINIIVAIMFITCIASAIILICLDREGWGWMIFLALVTTSGFQQIPDTKRMDE